MRCSMFEAMINYLGLFLDWSEYITSSGQEALALIHPREFNTCVISLQDLFIGPALFREPISAHLTHADTMSPAAAGEDKLRYASIIVSLAVDYKELFT